MGIFDRYKKREEMRDDTSSVMPYGMPPSPQGEGFGNEANGWPVGVGAFARQPQAMVIDEALATPVIAKEQLSKASQTLREYMAGKARLDQRLIENDKWWRQRHWDVIPEKGTTQLKTKSAWLVNVVLSKHADAMDALPEPNCLPRAADDKEEAIRLSKVLPVVIEEAEFADAWTGAWWNKLKGGTAIYGVFWDKAKHNGLGDVAIRAVDPLKLYWEPGCTRIQDSRNLFLLDLVDNETLVEQYPELDGKLGGKDVTIREYYHDDHINTADKSPVVDWYYKKRVGGKSILHYVRFTGEHVLYATENDPQRTDTGLYDHGLYPFFEDVLFPEEGTPSGFGYIDLCKDAQRQIDLMNNAIVANCVAAATPRWLKRGEDGINEEEYADWTKPIVHVQGSLDDNAIRQITVSPLSGNYLNILESKINEMKETSGNRDVNNGGAPSGVTAASAIAAMQEQSGKLSRDQIRTSYNTFKNVVSCVIEVMRQYYDAPRNFRITGDTGQEEFVYYDNRGLMPKNFTDPQTGMQIPSKPLFDLKITAQRSTEYTKMAQNELALQLYQLGMFAPNNADPALATLEMMDFDGKEEVMQTVQRNGGMFQMIQMLQQENMMLKASMGMPAQGMEGLSSEGGRPMTAPTGDSGNKPAKVGQADELASKGVMEPNRIADKAKAKAQAATQPR